MLTNWFNPVPQSIVKSVEQLSKYQLGKKITIHFKQFPDLKSTKIALLGMDKGYNEIRKSLYQMTYNFGKLKIVDLGNLKDNHQEVIILVVQELLVLGIIPVLIGKNIDTTYAQYLAYKTSNQLINIVLLDERIHLTLDKRKKSAFYLNRILNDKERFIFNLGIIGYQSHYVDQDVLWYLENEYFEYLRVGRIKNNVREVEPIVRDADLMSINIAALKKAEAPGHETSSPSGLFTEEACQIAHYAGMSDKLSSIGFYGFEPTLDRENQTAQVIAQMVWYFIHGVYSRKHDYPVSMGSFVEYIVDFKDDNFQITFWKSTKSNRWWMEIPTMNERQKRHHLIPCSYQDYQLAGRGELSERLLNAYYNRFS